MSEWNVKGCEDVVTFHQLARMYADGDLQHGQPVKLVTSSCWQRLDSVVGIHRAAEKVTAEVAPVSAADSVNDCSAEISPDAEATTTTEPARDAPETNVQPGQLAAIWVRLLFAFVVGLLLCHAYSQWSFQTRFPLPAHAIDEAGNWKFPLIGNVTGLEYLALCVDSRCCRIHRLSNDFGKSDE